MSAPICVECEQPREYGATLLHVCHCDESAGDLRVLVHLRDTEVTRLRAALAEIAARHTPSPDDDTPASGPSESLRGAYGQGFDASTFVAAEMARKGLVKL